VNRYNLLLLILTITTIPLFRVSGWLGLVALLAIYALLARLANNDFDRLSGPQSRRAVVMRNPRALQVQETSIKIATPAPPRSIRGTFHIRSPVAAGSYEDSRLRPKGRH